MYDPPTLSMLGFLPAMIAIIHFIVVWSAHIGLCLGNPGGSGMQLQPLLPSRRTLIFCSLSCGEGQSMTVACSVTDFDSANSAFDILRASRPSEDASEGGADGGRAASCAIAKLTPAISKETATISGTTRFMTSPWVR